MDAEMRKQKLLDTFSTIIVAAQLFGMPATYGAFLDDFENQVRNKLGECTEEDKAWCLEELDWFVKKNSAKPKQRKSKKN